MAKVKVRVLYPTAFVGLEGYTDGDETVSVDAGDAEQLVAAGYAEEVKTKASTKE